MRPVGLTKEEAPSSRRSIRAGLRPRRRWSVTPPGWMPDLTSWSASWPRRTRAPSDPPTRMARMDQQIVLQKASTKATIAIAPDEKAELEARAEALGIPVSEAFRLGAALYLSSLELQARPKPRPGRPKKS